MPDKPQSVKTFLESPPKSFFKILIVDDERVICEVLRGMLEEFGYTDIDTVYTGEEAISALSRKEYHLVLLDKNLPKMDGMEVLKDAKILRPDTEVIMITAYGSLETAIRAMDDGAYSYITKPFPEFNIIMSRVEGALKRVVVQYQMGQLLDHLEGVLDPLNWTKEKLDRQKKMERVLDVVGSLRVLLAEIKKMRGKMVVDGKNKS
jgi:DNA-binding NtrC family response regulator